MPIVTLFYVTTVTAFERSAAGNTIINGNGSVSASNVIVDLFCWSTSATTYGIHNSEDYRTYSGDFVDWGNTIGDGWRTLTESEWGRVYTRTSGSTVNGTINARYTFATINTDGTGVNGMILFPDGVIIDSGEATWGTINGHSVWGTKCTSAQWAALAAKGCVFLPAAGGRKGAKFLSDSSFGIYWSSSVSNVYEDAAWGISFAEDEDEDDDFVIAHYYRYIGSSVRLVRDVK